MRSNFGLLDFVIVYVQTLLKRPLSKRLFTTHSHTHYNASNDVSTLFSYCLGASTCRRLLLAGRTEANSIVSSQLSTPRNARVKRFLKNREAKTQENIKTAIFIRGSHTSQIVNDALLDLVSCTHTRTYSPFPGRIKGARILLCFYFVIP